MNLTLNVWRQVSADSPGRFEKYDAKDISPDMSFLDMLDLVNEQIVLAGGEAVAFDHDCREGICGTCGVMVDGVPHGDMEKTTVCQLHMRHFSEGDEIWIEPWRSKAFPVLRDLIVDRNAFDRLVQSGGYISVRTGSAPDANAIPIRKEDAELSMDAAACIGCGACVAACPNASAMLFMAAKVSHLGLLPQGQPERYGRVMSMLATHDAEGFGGCTNHGACENACPKGISVDFIARLNRDLVKAVLTTPTDG